MGGAIILGAVLVAYFAAHLATLQLPTMSALLVLFLMTGLGIIGFLDDFIKISKQRSLGLRSKQKLAGQIAVGVVFAVLALNFRNDQFRTPASPFISFVRDTHINLAFAGTIGGVLLFVIWANIIIAGTSNGVNLTDGLDGLAAGVSTMVLGAYVLIGIWTSEPELPDQPGHQVLRGPRQPRPRRRGRGRDGRLLRVPLVERLAGQDLHGRHRVARAGRPHRRAGDLHAHRAARRRPRRPLRPRGRSP